VLPNHEFTDSKSDAAREKREYTNKTWETHARAG
jgi:hypothetical protein